jgi:putative transposase
LDLQSDSIIRLKTQELLENGLLLRYNSLMKIHRALTRFVTWMAKISDKQTQDILLQMQKSLDYCQEESRVLREVLRDQYGCKQLQLTDSQRRRLASKGHDVGRHLLKQVSVLFSPDTIIGWYRKLVAQKYDGSRSRKAGRPRTSKELVDLVIRIARNNPSWDYDRIRGVIEHLGFEIGKTTIRRILDDHGIVPDPEQKRRIRWKEFLASHKEVLAATDFCCVELLTKRGLVRCMILFFIDIASRRVEIAGIKASPDGLWMKQVARNITDSEDGFLKDNKYLIHDRDSLYTKEFDEIIESSGTTIIKTSVCAPDMNAYSERFVQTLKFECLNKMIFTSQDQLEYAVSEFMTYYHRERPHQGLGRAMIDPWPQDEDGEIVEFQRLGGLLKSYRRVKMAA